MAIQSIGEVVASSGIESESDSALEATARDIHRQRSLAEDCVSSNSAAADALKSAIQLMRGGGFESVTNQICDTSDALESTAETTVRSIGEAAEVLRAFTSIVADFESSFSGLMDVVTRIRKSASEISEIARQSGLLSLNARIEATRAGSADAAGFGVVATEVGNLSRRTTGISDSITDDMTAIKSAFDQMASRFASTKVGLEQAKQSVGALEACSSTIRDQAGRLVATSHEVEGIAWRQTELNEMVECVERHVEMASAAGQALGSELAAANVRIDAECARRRAPSERFVDRSGLDRFESEFASAIETDDPARGRRALETALAAGSNEHEVLERIASASSHLSSVALRKGIDPPLETHFRNSWILREALDELERRRGDEPRTAAADAPVVVLGNAFEDYHDLGRRIVTIALRADGVSVIDLGLSVSNERLIEAAVEHRASVIGVSTLLLHTAKWIPLLRQDLDRRGLRHVKVIAGGAIFHVDPRLRERFGADGVGRTPSEAVRLVRHFHALTKDGARGGKR